MQNKKPLSYGLGFRCLEELQREAGGFLNSFE
jgi:hypothetical protein